MADLDVVTNVIFNCPESDCNRKYKNEHQIIHHLKNYHKILNPVKVEPIITSTLYKCNQCSKKYKTTVSLNKHIINCKNVESVHESAPINNLFYMCPELNCKRKYKVANKLTDHLLKDHSISDYVITSPVEVTQNNKDSIERNKNALKRQEIQSKLILEAENKRKIAELAKEQALKQYEEDVINKEKERLYQIQLDEKKKLEAEYNHLFEIKEAESKRLDQIKVDINKNLDSEYIETLKAEKMKLINNEIELEKERQESSTCSICMDNPNTTVMIPCGHQRYCYECADAVMKSSGLCPHCRSNVIFISKVII